MSLLHPAAPPTQPSQPIIIQKQKSRKLMEKWLLEEKNIEIMMGGY